MHVSCQSVQAAYLHVTMQAAYLHGYVSMNTGGIKDDGAYLVKALVCECQPKILGLLAINIAWRWFAIVDVAVHSGVITG